jgi:DNA-binding winged helix-turn-helix (wHTH) protein/TolB-like protein/Tfp pilus assembly protein PilF
MSSDVDDPPFSHFFFDDIVVEVSAHRVLRAGVECELEPKAFAVLLEFVSRPGELLGRDRLLDSVWGHRHVTPSVLNRVVANLRRSMGDDFAQPRYIETVHGLGYRFIAPVRTSTEREAMRAVEPAAHVAVERPATASQSPEPPAPGRPISSLLLATLLAIAAVSVAILLFRDLARHTVPSPKVDDDLASLAIVPFTARGGNEDLVASMLALSESLTDTLARDASLRVAGRTSVASLGSTGENVETVAKALDVDYVLTGEARPIAEGLVLTTKLWRHGQAWPIWIDQRTAPSAELFSVAVPLLARVRAEMLPDAAANSTPAITTSLPVQDLYWLGRKYWYERTPSSLARALEYFQRAVREDPEFALGYTGIADTYVLLYEYADMPLDEASRRARSAIARAKELEPDLADAYASEGLVLLDETDAPAGSAVRPLERALELSPQHPNARLWYGDALAYAGRPREATAWHERTLKDDPLNALLHTYLGVAIMLTGDEAGASAHFQRAIALDPNYAEPMWQTALQHEMHGRTAQATQVFQEARRIQGASAWNSLHLANAALLRGDAAAAELLLEEVDETSIDRYEMLAWARWQQRKAGLREEVDRVPPRESSTRFRQATLARIALDEGRPQEALERYGRLFGEEPDRADPFFRPWLPTLGLGHYAAWIALLDTDDPTRARALEAYARQLEGYTAGGVDVPPLTYHKALLAALRHDTASAERGLAKALAEGWLDVAALERDLGWNTYRNTDWMARAGELVRARSAEERSLADLAKASAKASSQ